MSHELTNFGGSAPQVVVFREWQVPGVRVATSPTFDLVIDDNSDDYSDQCSDGPDTPDPTWSVTEEDES